MIPWYWTLAHYWTCNSKDGTNWNLKLQSIPNIQPLRFYFFFNFFFMLTWFRFKNMFHPKKNIKMWLHERGPCNVIWSYRQTFVKYVHGMEWQMKLGHADATHIYKTTSCLCHTMGSHLGHFFMHSSIVFLQFLQPCWGVVLH